jgi:hypothetical protein
LPGHVTTGDRNGLTVEFFCNFFGQGGPGRFDFDSRSASQFPRKKTTNAFRGPALGNASSINQFSHTTRAPYFILVNKGPQIVIVQFATPFSPKDSEAGAITGCIDRPISYPDCLSEFIRELLHLWQ